MGVQQHRSWLMVGEREQWLQLAMVGQVAPPPGETRILLVGTQMTLAREEMVLVLWVEQVARFQPVPVPVMEMYRAVEVLAGHKYLEEVVEQGDLDESYLHGQ